MILPKKVFAIAAHPDDIEFQMAGTLILLKNAGYQLHYLNIANGSCGTVSHQKEEIIEIRRTEARAAAKSIGAIYHESLVDDFAIYYEPTLLARLAAIMRAVSPDILLLQSPQDYMEDHQNTVRLAASAAFTMGMSNFQTHPSRQPVQKEVVIYHAQPHGNRDLFGNLIKPGIFVDITSVIDQKTKMLSYHKSQKDWLDKSQHMDAYLQNMQSFAKEIGNLSLNFKFAEGWRKRWHLGYCDESQKPLEKVLASYLKFAN